MKVIQVEMWAFQNGVIREVRIPDEACGSADEMLNAVYHFGQNDIQPVEGRCSVSVGDVILLDGERYLVMVCGFTKMSAQDYGQYLASSSVGRISRSLRNGSK
jgi:hypothetical protein